MANIKIIKSFRLGGILQMVGSEISVDNDKAKYIIDQGWAEGEIPKPKAKAKAKAKKKK